MTDQKLILKIGDHQVLSELSYDASHPSWTRVWITSTCGEHTQRNVLSIDHRPGYTETQAEHDIEEARWRFGAQVAAKAVIRSTVSGLIRPGQAPQG